MKTSSEERVEHTPRRFRKKPVVIEAVQIWANSEWPTNVRFDENKGGFAVYDRLHDTWVKFESGDWIITGVKGEMYPCKPDVFDATYESVSDQPSSEQTSKNTEREALVSALRAALDIIEGRRNAVQLGNERLKKQRLFRLTEVLEQGRAALKAAGE